jgi:glycosidase
VTVVAIGNGAAARRAESLAGPRAHGLKLARAMRHAAALLLALTGCPSTQDTPGDDAPDAAPIEPDAAMACTAIASCQVTVRVEGLPAATTVSLRGDFAPDGWTAGVPMTREGTAWVATIDAADEQVVVYKLVVDGAWTMDPANPRVTPDGFGGQNSVLKADCDQCPGRPAIDWRDAVIYFVMIDRFLDGDPSNSVSVPGAEPPGQYLGGDLAGLRAKIEEGYFDALGVNTLWITAPFDNADGAYQGSDGHVYSGYHGYWPKDLDAVESHVGTEAELRAVVDAAHARNLQVLVDYVMNHVHADSPVYQQHPGWFWPNDNGFGGNCICGAGCDWNAQRLRCWFDPFLPDFDFTNGDARRWSVDNAVAWAKRMKLDGFRLDAVKHIETPWLTDLRARLTGEATWDQPFYLVGETFEGDRNVIRAYVDPATMLDGQFDFPLRANVLRSLLRRDGPIADLAGFLDSNDGFYGPGAVMSTFLGNHDVPRVVHIAEDSPQFGEWDGGKDRAWQNQPQLPQGASAFERLAVAYTLLYTIPGVPMIYYGDEYAMPGAGDPDNRRMMQWTGHTPHQLWLRDRLATLGRVRQEHAALRRGTRATLGASGDVLVYSMTSPGETIYVALNRGDAAQPAVNLPAGDYVDLVSNAPVAAPVSVPARSAFVLVRAP